MILLGTYSEWVDGLAQSGALAEERRRFSEELCRRGWTFEQADRASSNYTPNPKMLGDPEFAATQHAHMCRLADLHLAYQHGEAAGKGDTSSEPEFKQRFAGDAEAEREYQRGLVEQLARQSELPKSVH